MKPNSAQGFVQILIIFLVLLGFALAFGGGFLVARKLEPLNSGSLSNNGSIPEKAFKKVASDSAQPPEPPKNQIKIDTSGENVAQETTTIVPGKKYYEETVMMMTKSEPHLSFIATIVRLEQEVGFTQNSRISFYDGANWKRNQESRHLNDSTVVGGKLIQSWEVSVDPSRVLKEGTTGRAIVDNHQITFRTGVLKNEVSMRSLPGYTKFMSKGDGILTIDGRQYPVYEVFTKIYSVNSSDIQFYNSELKVTTDWIAFWDTEGNLYHLDMTTVPNPTDIYASHQIGFRENAQGVLWKTFSTNVIRDQKTPPEKYVVTFGDPINHTLEATLQNAVNKGGINWFMGQIKGTIKREDGSSVDGVGIVEYIKE